MQFETDLTYTSRVDKPKYVADKYGPVLTGSVLDVGADKGLLGAELDSDVDYWGIGLADGVDEVVNLEEDGVPYGDDSYTCVICLDVLEHLDNIHEVFDELCRVSSEYVIISLPNPWASFMKLLRDGYYDPSSPMKFYNLPVEAPIDRHKWFYRASEAEEFIKWRAEKNGAEVLQIDREESVANPIKRKVYEFGASLVFHDDLNPSDLTSGNIWCLLSTDERQ